MPPPPRGRVRQGALVLAAGSGQRFGSDKRVARLADGRHVLCASLAPVAEAFDDWRLVLRAGRDASLPARLAVDRRRVTFSERAARGMGAALADAVRQAPSEWDVLWVALGDMPWIDSATLFTLQDAAAREPTRIVRPRYRGRSGHPVAWPRALRDQLEALDGDAGARDLLRRHPERLYEIDVEDVGVLSDVDHSHDLAGHGVTNGNET